MGCEGLLWDGWGYCGVIMGCVRDYYGVTMGCVGGYCGMWGYLGVIMGLGRLWDKVLRAKVYGVGLWDVGPQGYEV